MLGCFNHLYSIVMVKGKYIAFKYQGFQVHQFFHKQFHFGFIVCLRKNDMMNLWHAKEWKKACQLPFYKECSNLENVLFIWVQVNSLSHSGTAAVVTAELFCGCYVLKSESQRHLTDLKMKNYVEGSKGNIVFPFFLFLTQTC